MHMAFERPFEHSEGFKAADLNDPRLLTRISSKLKRSGMSEKEYLAKLGKIWEIKPVSPQLRIPQFTHKDV